MAVETLLARAGKLTDLEKYSCLEKKKKEINLEAREKVRKLIDKAKEKKNAKCRDQEKSFFWRVKNM